jgi:hypothetical protein
MARLACKITGNVNERACDAVLGYVAQGLSVYVLLSLKILYIDVEFNCQNITD